MQNKGQLHAGSLNRILLYRSSHTNSLKLNACLIFWSGSPLIDLIILFVSTPKVYNSCVVDPLLRCYNGLIFGIASKVYHIAIYRIWYPQHKSFGVTNRPHDVALNNHVKYNALNLVALCRMFSVWKIAAGPLVYDTVKCVFPTTHVRLLPHTYLNNLYSIVINNMRKGTITKWPAECTNI